MPKDFNMDTLQPFAIIPEVIEDPEEWMAKFAPKTENGITSVREA